MSITQILSPKTKDLGGFTVSRLLPAPEKRMVGPWIFFDHMGPANFSERDGINVRPHPHINLATVTYLFEGEIIHRDSLGSHQAIRPGDINLMVAGKGITHSERTENKNAHTVHGLQLWHALPENEEEREPAFYHYSKEETPSIMIQGVDLRVMIGSCYGVTSPVKVFHPTLYVEASFPEGKTLQLPEAEELGVYVVKGTIEIDSQKIDTGCMAILENNNNPILAPSKALIAIIGGSKMGKRYIEWNFVSSRKDRIDKAKKDWKNGSFPKVVGDEDEFIPLPE